jgi:hypothetical protein
MNDPGCFLYLHGNKLVLIPVCREIDSPFTVYESVEVFSTGVSDASLGNAIVLSRQKSRDDVRSNSEGLGLDELAKLFGERSFGGFEKRASLVIVAADGDSYSIIPTRWDGTGWQHLDGLRLDSSTSAETLAQHCRQFLARPASA